MVKSGKKKKKKKKEEFNHSVRANKLDSNWLVLRTIRMPIGKFHSLCCSCLVHKSSVDFFISAQSALEKRKK